MESPDYYTKETLVLGCGNVLFGDDGFGPEVADYILSHAEGRSAPACAGRSGGQLFKIPENTAVVNLGLSTRGFIFDILLSEQRPKRIIIVDAVSYDGRKPGEIFEVHLDNLVKEKVDDFSFHQGPTSNLLKELRDICGVDVVIIAAQPESIPKEMNRGLSEPLKKAVITASELIYNRYLQAGPPAVLRATEPEAYAVP